MSYTIDNTDGYSLEGNWCNLIWEIAPTQPGYYWAKDSEGKKQIVEFYELDGETGVYVMGTGTPYYVHNFVAWLGILPEPIG